MAAAPQRPCQILVVEDDEPILTMIQILLESSGYSAAVAEDGSIALEYLRQAQTLPDLILLDYQMPNMDGREFCQIQQDNPAWRDIPVILLSARHDLETVEQTMCIQAVLQKPFDPAHMLDLVARFCSQ